jgi:hypothetical protein
MACAMRSTRTVSTPSALEVEENQPIFSDIALENTGTYLHTYIYTYKYLYTIQTIQTDLLMYIHVFFYPYNYAYLLIHKQTYICTRAYRCKLL